MNYRAIFLFFLTFSFFLFSCQKKNQDQENSQPNILFILSDDHTSQVWGIYGGILQDYVQNKNIQRLANEGIVLENAFCTNSICSPSRACILTGQYNHLNQVYTLREPLPEGYPNIAKSLKEVGYQTALFGKWHLTRMPEGFDTFQVLPGQGVYHDPMFKTSKDWRDGFDTEKAYQIKGFTTDIITDMTMDYLDKRNTEKPFFVLCHFKATHEPFDYPERFAHLYEEEEIPEPASLYEFGPSESGRTFPGQPLEKLGERWEKATKDGENFWTSYPGLPYTLDGLDSLQKRKKIYQKFVKDFMRCGAAIDDNIGRLLDYLQENDLAQNTIVIYTADQGYFLGEHGFFDKRLIYEESLRMPFVIRYPKELSKGQRIDDIILNIDFPALLADYAGYEKTPEYMQGKSFRKVLNGTAKERHRTAMYYRYWLHAPNRPGHFGIRNDRYKLALFYGQGLGMQGASDESTDPQWEFYDLEKDPQEMHNAYHDSEYQETIEEMKQELIRLKAEAQDTDEAYPVMRPILEKELGIG